jgi:hypothetical protein
MGSHKIGLCCIIRWFYEDVCLEIIAQNKIRGWGVRYVAAAV